MGIHIDETKQKENRINKYTHMSDPFNRQRRGFSGSKFEEREEKENKKDCVETYLCYLTHSRHSDFNFRQFAFGSPFSFLLPWLLSFVQLKVCNRHKHCGSLVHSQLFGANGLKVDVFFVVVE